MKKLEDSYVNELAQLLQQVQHNFAYRMLFLQIQLSCEKQSNKNRSVEIAELTQLYMKAVQALQQKFDRGFDFFNTKIQTLMKKRSVVEELFKSVNSSLSNCESTMQAVSKAEVIQRKEEYHLRKYLHNDKYDHGKVKEMIKNAEMKINIIQSKIKTGIITQEQQLAQRIKLRRMKSESSTIGKQEMRVNRLDNMEQVGHCNSMPRNGEQYEQKTHKPRRSNDKKRKAYLFNSFTNAI